MAIITPFLFLRHVRGEPTSQILLWKDGKLTRSGRGLSFWFYPLGASLAEVPLDDRELPFLFHGRSADFQDVAVQGTILYRVAAPDVLAERVDFGLDTRTGVYAKQPLDKIALVVTELVQEVATGWVARAPLGRCSRRRGSDPRRPPGPRFRGPAAFDGDLAGATRAGGAKKVFGSRGFVQEATVFRGHPTSAGCIDLPFTEAVRTGARPNGSPDGRRPPHRPRRVVVSAPRRSRSNRHASLQLGPASPARCATAATSRAGATGFAMCISNPASSASLLS
jgi:hypothetical protein